MTFIKRKGLSIMRSVAITFAMLAVLFSFTFGVLFGPSIHRVVRELDLLFPSDTELNDEPFITKQQNTQIYPYEPNSTHLWSMRFADESYFRLARLLPCRIVEYQGGLKVDKIDSCDHSASNEFSIQNTLQAQKWLYEHQHPANCTNKKFAIINNFAWSGFGSTLHQIAWAFGMALAQDRIAVYKVPGYWYYGDCELGNPDCIFLPISKCSIPPKVDGQQTIHIRANFRYWPKPILPSVFQNRTFNWYRGQLLFYLMRYESETLIQAQNTIAQYFYPPSLDLQHPYIAIFVRRSDKVKFKEMSQAYSLKQYFDLFDDDARRANITSVYINSEDEQVFNEFAQINKEKQGYYKLLSVNATTNVLFPTLIRMKRRQRRKVVLEFLTDLIIEVNADLHVGTLTSNWCRLVDEMRLVLGKTIPYYTPENKYLMDIQRPG